MRRVLMCEGKSMTCNGSFSTADDRFSTLPFRHRSHTYMYAGGGRATLISVRQRSGATEPKWNRWITRRIFPLDTEKSSGNETSKMALDRWKSADDH